MADTTTTYYGLTKPEIGASEDTWGAKLNGDMDLIDTQMKSSDDLSSAALPKAGGTMTGDTLHGDGIKNKFGTGGDLEIYHNGTNSYIKDVGSGDLYIQSSDEIRIQDSNSSNYFYAVEGGGVRLYHGGSEKIAMTATGVAVTGNIVTSGSDLQNVNTSLKIISGGDATNSGSNLTLYGGANASAGTFRFRNGANVLATIDTTGIDVTGTVTADGLVVENLTAGTVASPNYANINFNGYLGRSRAEIRSHDTSGNTLGGAFEILTADSSNNLKSRVLAAPNGDISFYNTAGTTAKFFWDASAGMVLIGTESVNSGVVKPPLGLYVEKSSTPSNSVVTFVDSDISPSGNTTLELSTPNDDIWATKYEILFTNNTTSYGSISSNGTSVSYNTSSDHRLKTDVQPMEDATATFMQLNPVNFEWISSGERVDGFLAHELGEVIPAAATGTHNGMVDEEYEATAATGDIYTAGSDAGFNEVSPEVVGGPAYYDIDGVQIRAEIIAESAVHEAFDAVAEVIHSSDVEQPETLEDGQAWRETTPQVMATRSVPDMQGIDQSKIVPILVATLQEALARIEALEE